MRRAIGGLIATLLLLSIAVLSSTLVFVLTQHFSAPVQAGGSLSADVAEMVMEAPEIP